MKPLVQLGLSFLLVQGVFAAHHPAVIWVRFGFTSSANI
jgi:hypothetical protein